MGTKSLRIGVYLDLTRHYGREVSSGIARWGEETGGVTFAFGGDVLDARVAIARGHLDGVIGRVPDFETAEMLRKLKIPIVDVYGLKNYPGISHVECDHAAIGHLAAEWFLGRRYTSFAFVGFRDVPFSEARRDSFAAAVTKAGYEVRVHEGAGEDNFAHHLSEPDQFGKVPDAEKLERFLKDLPEGTAVFCANDYRAYHVLRSAAVENLAVPQRIAVMGVDNDPLLTAFATPTLSSIDSDPQTVGHSAAMLLSKLISIGRRAKDRQVVVPPCEVRERGSTDFDPVSPAWIAEAARYMRAHATEGINVTDVVRMTGKSHTLVTRVFAKSFGMNPHDFLIGLKVEAAVKMLKGTTIPIAEVAKRTGFTSPQYFNAVLAERFNQTPTQIRHEGGRA